MSCAPVKSLVVIRNSNIHNVVAGMRICLLNLGVHVQQGLQYLVCVSVCLSVWLTSTRFSSLAHRGRIKLLRGFVSSTALNLLTITWLACERPRGRSRTALHGPAQIQTDKLLTEERPTIIPSFMVIYSLYVASALHYVF